MWVIELATAVTYSLVELPVEEAGQVWFFIELLGQVGPWEVEASTRRLGRRRYELSFPCGPGVHGKLTYRMAAGRLITLLQLDVREGGDQFRRDRAGFEAEAGMLSMLSRLLPASERHRFVAEGMGNLGSCEHAWARIDHLLSLVMGMPRLAWLLHRSRVASAR